MSLLGFTTLLVGLEGMAQATNTTGSPSGRTSFLHETNSSFANISRIEITQVFERFVSYLL